MAKYQETKDNNEFSSVLTELNSNADKLRLLRKNIRDILKSSGMDYDKITIDSALSRTTAEGVINYLNKSNPMPEELLGKLKPLIEQYESAFYEKKALIKKISDIKNIPPKYANELLMINPFENLLQRINQLSENFNENSEKDYIAKLKEIGIPENEIDKKAFNEAMRFNSSVIGHQVRSRIARIFKENLSAFMKKTGYSKNLMEKIGEEFIRLNSAEDLEKELDNLPSFEDADAWLELALQTVDIDYLNNELFSEKATPDLVDDIYNKLKEKGASTSLNKEHIKDSIELNGDDALGILVGEQLKKNASGKKQEYAKAIGSSMSWFENVFLKTVPGYFINKNETKELDKYPRLDDIEAWLEILVPIYNYTQDPR